MPERILLQADYILTWDGELKLITQGEIVIEDSLITYLGSRQERPAENFGRVLKIRDSLVIPGFVNTHTHAAMALFRGYADDLSLQEWLQDKIWPAEAKLSSEDIYWGTLLAIAEMLKGGTTCFADMYFHMDEVARACLESGIRASLAQGLIGTDKIKGELGLRQSRSLVQNWHNEGEGRITVMLGPHAPYTCPPDYLYKVGELAGDLRVPIHIHLAETRREVEESRREHGKTPVELIAEVGLLEHDLLAAHCVHLAEADLGLLAAKNVAVAHNPGSNLKLGSGVAPVTELLQKGALVSLGTDGAASNNNLDLLEEMRLAALLQKGLREDPAAIPAETAFKMATVNGARALFLPAETGQLKVGAKADLAVLKIDKPHLSPPHSFLAHLVYSAAAADVYLVMVDGRVLMENGHLLTLDEEKILFEAPPRAQRLTE
ncbi:MAG: amidohydrolase [Firmicutes bacterium]|nr:amidohydrolase [Bacillota bacterium]